MSARQRWAYWVVVVSNCVTMSLLLAARRNEMQISYQNDMLNVRLLKSEERILRDAELLCRRLGMLAPVPDELQSASVNAASNLRAILDYAASRDEQPEFDAPAESSASE